MGTSMATSLTDHQLWVISVTERVNGSISLLGTCFVIGTYLFIPAFNKPLNRLLFFGSGASIGFFVFAWIAQLGAEAGAASALCQFQAFLVQMFLVQSALWDLAMASNVYLAFFRGYSIQSLHIMDLRYLILCYGTAAIPAFVFLFADRGEIYGATEPWCWIQKPWEYLRLGLCYAPVWFTIMAKTVIYLKAGRVIYKTREHLDGFLNPFKENPFNMVFTEVEIVRENRPSVEQVEQFGKGSLVPSTGFLEYSVDINAENPNRYDQPLDAIQQMRSLSKKVAENAPNPEAWLYARSAFLYYIACFIIWTPATIGRIYLYVHPDRAAFGFTYVTVFFVTLLGTFNCIVYCITSKAACRNLYRNLRNRTWTWEDPIDKYESSTSEKKSLWSTENSSLSGLVVRNGGLASSLSTTS